MQDDFVPSLFQQPGAGTAVAADPTLGPRFDGAWASLQAGKLGRALSELELLATDPNLAGAERYPVHVAMGVVRLTSGDALAALAEFDRALSVRPEYAPGRLGRAAVMYQRGDDEAALAELDRLAAVAPADVGAGRLRARVEERFVNRLLDRARKAEEAGDRREALGQIRRAAELRPGDLGLRRQEGGLALSVGEPAVAVAAYRAVTELAAADADGWLGLGEAQMAAGDPAAARLAFDRAAQLPGGLDRARERVTVLRDQQQASGGDDTRLRRAIDAPVLDRAGLAALLAVKLRRLERVPRSAAPQIVTDISGSWARSEIQTMVALNVVEVYDNHTYRPQGTVSRLMLARAAAAVLRICRDAGWLAERPLRERVVVDVPPEHLDYPAVLEVIRYGVMEADPEAGFRPSDPVAGAEALAVVERLAALVG